MDRNYNLYQGTRKKALSLSARRAWIEIRPLGRDSVAVHVALRKESVDRNTGTLDPKKYDRVALRKESVDRNRVCGCSWLLGLVALRKESVDRNAVQCRKMLKEMCRSPQGERG